MTLSNRFHAPICRCHIQTFIPRMFYLLHGESQRKNDENKFAIPSNSFWWKDNSKCRRNTIQKNDKEKRMPSTDLYSYFVPPPISMLRLAKILTQFDAFMSHRRFKRIQKNRALERLISINCLYASDPFTDAIDYNLSGSSSSFVPLKVDGLSFYHSNGLLFFLFLFNVIGLILFQTRFYWIFLRSNPISNLQSCFHYFTKKIFHNNISIKTGHR